MKYLINSLLILMLIHPTAFGQAKKRGKVKRKYTNVEQVNENLIPVYLRGEIYDWDKQPLAGASITIDGTRKGVHTNERGEFLIENLVTGKARLRISFVGFETKTTDVILRPGENFKKVMLRQQDIHLPAVSVSSQKREQQVLDVPAAISSVGNTDISNNNITELNQLSELVPGLMIREQGANRPSFVIRGLNSDEVSPSAQPRISVYMNQVPINRASTAAVELFDIERVEVLNGPQNSLFGRGAQAGAVHFISKKPVNTLEGSVTAGYGNYANKEARAMVNVPVLEDKLFIRASGVYHQRDGYVDNTFGGTLNGKNVLAGRLSTRFVPAWNHKIDLVVNYQKDDTPGIAFMSGSLPNMNGEVDIFGGTASLEQGENLGTGKDFYDATLDYRYYIDEHRYLSSISSYRNSSSFARWDGDGTASAAIDMSENADAKQFYQELRLNFSRNSRMNGSIGASYWWEDAFHSYGFYPNEQNTVHLFFDPSYLVLPSGDPISMQALPDFPVLGPLAGAPLPTDHQEENLNYATNQAVEVFLDGTYQLTRKIYLLAGIRGVYDMFKLSNEAIHTAGSPSTLGFLTQNYPNLFFKPNELQEISDNTPSVTGKAGIQYKFNEYGNVYASYSRGRRPKVLQFSSTGEKEILDAEVLHNYELGFKGSFFERVFLSTTGFYQQYRNFQTRAWVSNPDDGIFDYKVKDSGKASSYGAEVNIRAAILEELDFIGNYAWLHTAFDSTDVDGSEQEYVGNRFSLAPEHSYTIGLNYRTNITPTISFFLNPSYSWKSHIFFEDANTEGLEQDAYGLFNANTGLELDDPNVVLTIYGTNLLNEEYIISAGNTGSLFGIPTFVPGAPQMFGVKLTWNFK